MWKVMMVNSSWKNLLSVCRVICSMMVLLVELVS